MSAPDDIPAVGVEFCDQVAGIIDTWWTPKCGGEKVERVYLPVQTDDRTGVLQVVDKLEDLTDGRKVYVYPGGFGEKEAETRKSDLNFYQVYVSVSELFDRGRHTAGLAQTCWMDKRVKFLEGLFKTLNVVRASRTPKFTGRLAGAWADEAVVESSFDPIELREKDVWWALLRFSYVLQV